MWKRLIGAALVWLCAGTAAWGQDAPPPPERVAIAREVVELSGATDALGTVLDTMAPMMLDSMRARGVSPERANRYMEIVREEFMAEIPRVRDLIALAYANEFDEPQLREMRDFWATPTGQRLRQRMPALMEVMQQAGRLIGLEVAQRATARFQAELERPLDRN